ncbi:MAG: Mu-like prophage major head subunit gpT family protein [Gammaproteobacteria bacterium]|nr:Mu-like prophage major head subunit gpT family protein [Gammaproteobacteria bacterium]
MIINQVNLKNLSVAVRAGFNQGMNSGTTYWERIATRINSTTAENKYAWLGQFPTFREWIGDRQVKSLAAHDFTIKNRKFEATVSIPRDDIDDDNFGVYMPIAEQQGYAAKTHPDQLIFALLKDGFSQPCYDGQNFFDTDHPVGVEGAITSVSNMQSGSGEPWFLLDTSRPIKPLLFQVRRDYDLKTKFDASDENVWDRDEFVWGCDARVAAGFGLWQLAFGSKAPLDEANFNAAWAAMGSLKSDEGRPLGIMPKLLLVSANNRAAAAKVIEAAQKTGGESNTNYKAVEILVVPWLA